MQFLRLKDVIDKVGMSKSLIYELVGKGEFPAPFKPNANRRAVRWRSTDIDHYMILASAETENPEMTFASEIDALVAQYAAHVTTENAPYFLDHFRDCVTRNLRKKLSQDGPKKN